MPRKGTNKKHNAKTKKKNKGAVITVDYEEYDYGDIEEAGDGKNVFVVRNSGDSPLVIDHISSSCGCTTADYPQSPIAPDCKSRLTARHGTSVGSGRDVEHPLDRKTNGTAPNICWVGWVGTNIRWVG